MNAQKKDWSCYGVTKERNNLIKQRNVYQQQDEEEDMQRETEKH